MWVIIQKLNLMWRKLNNFLSQIVTEKRHTVITGIENIADPMNNCLAYYQIPEFTVNMQGRPNEKLSLFEIKIDK